MAQVGKSEFKRCRVAAGGNDMGAEPEWAASACESFSAPGYGSRLGGVGQRLRESFRISMPSKPVLAAIVVLMVVCIVLGVVAMRGVGESSVVISRSNDYVTETDSSPEDAAQTAVAVADGAETDSASVSLSESSGSVDSSNQSETAYICVYVAGQVMSPGVFNLPTGSRVYEAIDAAGGAMEGADLSAVNLARALSDEEMVYVPAVGEQAVPSPSSGVVAASQGGAAPVNVNTAGVEELKTLNGIGDVLAQAIVDERERNGPFSSVEDLTRVSGIGEKTLAKFADKVCI